MRIVGGRLRGRRLASPADRETRPTSDRVREAIFNVLAGGRLAHLQISRNRPASPPGDPVAGARVLDAFAGSGALGLEALSRGAADAVFMENRAAARRLCRTNIDALGLRDQAELLACDALAPPFGRQPCDLVFLDPPYGQGLAGKAAAALDRGGWIADEALLVVELGTKEAWDPPAGFVILDDRRYGKTRVLFLGREPT